MKGLSAHTEAIFEKVSKMDSIKDYCLIGGTALSLQIDKRLSEDLDFCKWSTAPGKDKPTVNWKNIEDELNEKVGKVEKVDVLGENQTNFIVEGVNLSFYANQHMKSPIKSTKTILNNIIVPDLETIGAMKLEVMARRSKFRDYYDIYSILKEGEKLTTLIDRAVSYSGGRFKSKNIASYVSNPSNFGNDPEFKLLEPKYKIDAENIANHVREKLKEENPFQLSKAIYNNDKKRVKDILSRGVGIIGQKHIDLISDMKKDGMELDSAIEQNIKQTFKEEKKNSKGFKIK